MLKIEVVIGPSRLEAVQQALHHPWVAGLTVTELKGDAGGPVERFRGAAVPPRLTPLLRVEVVVPTPLLPSLVEALSQALRAGRGGDERLVITPVDEAIQVRTGERGEAAL